MSNHDREDALSRRERRPWRSTPGSPSSEDSMPVAHSIDLSSHPSLSSGRARRSGAAGSAVLVAALVALTLALLGCAYLGVGTWDGYPDATQQWTD
jgi:hypothetical protein